MSFKDSFRKTVLFANESVKRASGYATVLNEMGNLPGAHNYIAAGIKLAKVGFEHARDRAFDLSNLQRLKFIGGLAKDDVDDLILKRTRSIGAGSLERSNSFEIEEQIIHIIPKDEGIYCGKEVDPEKVKESLARLIWQHSNGCAELLPDSDYYPQIWSLRLSGLGKVYDSDYSDKITTKLSRFLKYGANRSVLLYGLPGSGKTCIAYAIAKNLSKRTLVIGCATGMAPAKLLPVIDELKPDLIILNEVDKVIVTGGILEFIESAKIKTKVMIGTSNTKDLPAAFLRPGRFDELLNVDKIDETTLKGLVNFPHNQEMLEEMKEWPVVFVSELRNRYNIDPEFLQEHFLSLKERVELNKKKEEKKP